MKRLQQILGGQRGVSLPLALIAVAIGTLLIFPVLAYVSTGYRTTVKARRTLLSQYTDDAGVEYGMWVIAKDEAFRQTLVDNLGVPQAIVAPGPVNGITPTIEAVCVVTNTGSYWAVAECVSDDCPPCDGATPTIFVIGGIIVGGPDDGESYNGTLNGWPGDDIIMGTDGADHVNGGAGNDIICGGAGADHLNGDDGDDTLCGGDGNDDLYGGAGDDILYGGAGNDIIDGGDDNDFMCGGSGNDNIWGGTGQDHLNGGDGQDVATAWAEDGADECCHTETESGCDFTCGAFARPLFDVRAMSEGITTTARASYEVIYEAMDVWGWH